LREGGKITEIQRATLKELKAKRDAPFELSDTAKKPLTMFGCLKKRIL
jgi:hypothetical protein